MLTLDVIGRVETGDGVWPEARVLADATSRAAIWRADHGQSVLAWSAHGVTVESLAPPRTPPAAGPWRIHAPDGVMLTVTRSGCGCGSPLRALGEMDLATLGIPAATS